MDLYASARATGRDRYVHDLGVRGMHGNRAKHGALEQSIGEKLRAQAAIGRFEDPGARPGDGAKNQVVVGGMDQQRVVTAEIETRLLIGERDPTWGARERWSNLAVFQTPPLSAPMYITLALVGSGAATSTRPAENPKFTFGVVVGAGPIGSHSVPLR